MIPRLWGIFYLNQRYQSKQGTKPFVWIKSALLNQVRGKECTNKVNNKIHSSIPNNEVQKNIFKITFQGSRLSFTIYVCGLSKMKKPILIRDEKSAPVVSEKIYITRILRTSFTSSDSYWRRLDPKSIRGYSCHLQQRQMQIVVYRAGQYGPNY